MMVMFILKSSGNTEVDVVQKFRVNAVLIDQLSCVLVSVLLEHLKLTGAVVLASFGEGLNQGVFGVHGVLV